ncbi:MAG: T9SS type A sorting domain-containing protein [Lepagella sp.]
MKKVISTLAMCVLGASMMGAQDYKLYKTETMATFTDVANDGTAVGHKDQNTPFFIWNPFTEETTIIGGVSAGNGLGGVARITSDARYVIGCNQFVSVPLPNDGWIKDVYPDYSTYRITHFLRPSSLIFLATAVDDSGNSIVLESSGGKGENWKSNVSGETFAGQEITCSSWAGPYAFFVFGKGGKFFASKGNSVWTERNLVPTNFEGEIKDFTAIDCYKMGSSDMYFDACVGYETTDGGYGVLYVNDTQFKYFDYYDAKVAEGVAGIPTSIRYVADPDGEVARLFYLTTNDGKIQKSVDRGKTWTTIYEGSKALYNIIFDTPQRAIALSDEVILKTTDGGETWTEVNVYPAGPTPWSTESPLRWNDAVYSGDRIILAGNFGRMYESTDDGESFAAVEGLPESVLDNDFLALDYYAENLTVGSESGTVLRKKDNAYIYDAVAVGRCNIEDVDWEPFDNLGTFATAIAPTNGSVYGISDDGSYSAGLIYSEVSEENHNVMAYAAVWDEMGHVTRLDNMFDSVEERNCNCRANAVSADGSVVVGWQDRLGPWMASVWRRQDDGSYKQELIFNDPETTIEDVDFTDFESIIANCPASATAVSANGEWIGGAGCTTEGGRSNAWIWSKETGFIEIPSSGQVMEISDDGKTAIGFGQMGFGGWLWTEEGGIQNLPISGSAYSMSENGRFICGFDGFEQDRRGYVLDLKPEQSNVEEIAAEQMNATVYMAGRELHIDLPYKSDKVATTFTLYNLHGTAYRQMASTGFSNVMNVSDLAAGVYVLNIKAGNHSRAIKVIIK